MGMAPRSAAVAAGLAIAILSNPGLGASSASIDYRIQSFPRALAAPSGTPRANGFGVEGPRTTSAARPASPARKGEERSGARSRDAQSDDPAVVRARLLDQLFDRLRRSSDQAEAEGVADAIQRVWLTSGSDTADFLMARALRAVHDKKMAIGLRILEKVVEIEPRWAEAWNELAVTRALSDDTDGAMNDIAHVLALEPRHFGAMAGLGVILMESGDKRGALRVFRRTLALYPRLNPVQDIVRQLSIEVDGRDL